MEPKKMDMYECDVCHSQEFIPVNAKPKIMNLKVGANEYQWCVDCVYQITPWRKHVNEEHLSGPKRNASEVTEHDKSSTAHVDALGGAVKNLGLGPMEHLSSKGEVTTFDRVVG